VLPGAIETLLLLKVQLSPIAGETREENVTEPLNPYEPATVKLATPVPPGVMMIADLFAGGFTVIEKSGRGTVRIIVVDSVRVPLVAVTTIPYCPGVARGPTVMFSTTMLVPFTGGVTA